MTAPLLRVRGLGKSFGRVRALDNVSFDVGEGEIVAVLGPNGAGKTTCFRCILGITRFDGDIELQGLSVAGEGQAARALMGYVPQSPDVTEGDTCAGLLSFLCELRGVNQRMVRRALDRVGLLSQANAQVSHLSGGMKQRLAFAAALLSDPPLLLLDEPTSSLDVQSQAQFHDQILDLRKAGKTALIATHYTSRLTGVADRAIVLDAGKLLFSGPMEELLRKRSKKSFVVNINGSSVESFHRALAQAGLGPDKVQPVEASWDEILSDIVGTGRERAK